MFTSHCQISIVVKVLDSEMEFQPHKQWKFITFLECSHLSLLTENVLLSKDINQANYFQATLTLALLGSSHYVG